MSKFIHCLFIMITGIALSASLAFSEEGVTDKEILIGMSNALNGPAMALGSGIKTGSSIYFNKVNLAGGIRGRRIKLVSYDDGYEPEKAVVNTKKLIEEDKVFALFGFVGTPTSSAVMPIFSKAGVPYIAPFTGAEILRNPVNKFLFNVRASYFDETETMVEHLTKDLGIKKIGVFVQADSFGDAGRAGVMRALKRRDLVLTGDGKYTRNTIEIGEGLEALKKANPEAVIMVGTYKPCAEFIKKAKSQGFRPKFLNISFVGTYALIQELGSDGDGVIVTQVVPNPIDSTLPVVKQYKEDMNVAGRGSLDFTSLEGYIDAVVLTEAIKKSESLTRSSFLSTLEGLNVNIGGLQVSFSPSNNKALKEVFLTKIEKGKAISVSKLE
ncbi:MAG: ABC transporter substrate-binding protein [Nitrospirae bacterium]|nr:ABC transporter substrate-binding protein [Nitrospirota bacterium]